MASFLLIRFSVLTDAINVWFLYQCLLRFHFFEEHQYFHDLILNIHSADELKSVKIVSALLFGR